MIRRMAADDLETVGAIWLEASIKACHFTGRPELRMAWRDAIARPRDAAR